MEQLVFQGTDFHEIMCLRLYWNLLRKFRCG